MLGEFRHISSGESDFLQETRPPIYFELERTCKWVPGENVDAADEFGWNWNNWMWILWN